MNQIKVLLLSISLIFLSCAQIFGQLNENYKKTDKKNKLHITYGNILLAHNVALNYERKILGKLKKLDIPLFDEIALSTGVGINKFTFDLGDNPTIDRGPIASAKLIFLKGDGHKFFEYGLGTLIYYGITDYKRTLKKFEKEEISYHPKKKDYIYNYKSFHLGYRFEKKEGGMLFRAGLSFPEGLYIGTGFRF